MYILIALSLICLVLVLVLRFSGKGDTETAAAEAAPRPDGCCGAHEVCEKESLLAAVSKGQIDDSEDEELAAFQGRPADQYSEAETEAFRDVLYTMRSEEVAGWVRSLALRGVELCGGLKVGVGMRVSVWWGGRVYLLCG